MKRVKKSRTKLHFIKSSKLLIPAVMHNLCAYLVIPNQVLEKEVLPSLYTHVQIPSENYHPDLKNFFLYFPVLPSAYKPL
jgi:hypothetical protein